MTRKRIANVAASHRAKLLNLARERGDDFQFLLGRWIVERFLYRLATSTHRDSFVLKGAMLFLAWEGMLHRPTRDLDLLGFGSSNVDDVVHLIQEICSVPAADGILFDLAEIEGDRIKEDAEYEGVRIRVPASLDGAIVSMQIDVGFGDLVDPPPTVISFPVLLPLDAPRLRAYPPEAVIAEKFHAMVLLGIANSRMKDFFDIWTLASTRRFELNRLASSLQNTFERRKTRLPEDEPVALTDEFLEDLNKRTQWNAFGRRLGLRELPSLAMVGRMLSTFLMPAVGAVAVGCIWEPGGPWRP